MICLVTGCAGFIGMHVTAALLERGDQVLGIDNLNPYYDVALKEARLDRLRTDQGFRFLAVDIADRTALGEAVRGWRLSGIVHLAAQAGVRHSLEQPFSYAHSNLEGHLAILELARHTEGLEHLVYASSSSVYGANRKVPFSVSDPVNHPVSLYAATKRSGELMSEAYARLFGLPLTGLRFFTVYGPWGRPDMAYWGFTDAIAAGRPITLFNEGRASRDLTFIDDIVRGVLAALDQPPPADDANGGARHRLFNLGNSSPIELLRLVELIEAALGRRAQRVLAPLPPGDVVATWADIAHTEAVLGWRPRVTIEEGILRFVDWFRSRGSAV